MNFIDLGHESKRESHLDSRNSHLDSRDSRESHESLNRDSRRESRFKLKLPRFDRFDLFFVLIVLCSLSILCYMISGASVSFNELESLESGENLISKLANISIAHFGANDFALKAPNLAFHALNLTLIYLISNRILKYKKDSLLCVIVYASLPAVLMQGAILNESSLMLFIVLLVCYIELLDARIAYPLVFLAIFVDSSAFMLFLALFFYTIFLRKFKSAIFAFLALSANLYIFGIDISGRPSGRFLDVVGELSLLYSPPLFVYYIYTLWRNISRAKSLKSANLLLFISVTSIAVSILLSVRQSVDKEIFLFMSLCGIPLMIKQFLSEIRLRLPQFQNAYKNRFLIVLFVLIFEALLLVFSKQVYANLNNGDNFLAQFYLAKEIALELKKRNISRVSIEDGKMRKRLAFYGIKSGGQKLRKVKRNGNIIIKYNDKIISRWAI